MSSAHFNRLNPWAISSSLHVALVALVLLILWQHSRPQSSIDIMVVENPHVSAQAVALTQPKPIEQPKVREIYGISRKALTAENGLDVKQGNTIAKTPDTEKLRADDADSIPIPTEDYLVTQMPQLEHEVIIPYPPDVKKRGVQGAVIMDLLIDSQGHVRKVDLVEGPDPELNAAATTAAKDFIFKPAFIQDKPVAVKIRYAYKFVIRG